MTNNPIANMAYLDQVIADARQQLGRLLDTLNKEVTARGLHRLVVFTSWTRAGYWQGRGERSRRRRVLVAVTLMPTRARHRAGARRDTKELLRWEL